MRGLSVVKFPRDCTADTPLFTGIVPHVNMLSEIEKLSGEITSLYRNISTDFKNAIDERRFHSFESNIQQVIQAMKMSSLR